MGRGVEEERRRENVQKGEGGKGAKAGSDRLREHNEDSLKECVHHTLDSQCLPSVTSETAYGLLQACLL